MHRRDDQRAVTIFCRPHTPAESGLGPSYFRKAGRPERDFRVGECIGDLSPVYKLKGASVVVDVSNSPSWEDAAVMNFFETSTRNLLAYKAAAGVGHHVASIPHSIVRATQFYEFIKGIADFSTDGDKVRLPPVLIQPMAADDVASAVGRTAMGLPVNGTVEVGGPEKFRLDELIRLGLVALKDPREVVADPHARYYGIEVKERTLVPEDDAKLGEIRFDDWLAQGNLK